MASGLVNEEGNNAESTSSLNDKEENNTESCEEIRLVLIGKTGIGKSASGNSILGVTEFISKSLATSVTKTCERKTTTILGKKVVVVDTPGFFDSDAADEVTVKEITKLFTLTSPGPHAVILVSEIKRFCEDDQKAFEKFSQIFGESVIDFVIVLFTGADALKHSNETFEYFINGLPAEQIEFLNKCENRYLAFDNTLVTDGEGHNRENAERLIKMVEQLIVKNKGESYTHELYMATEIQILSRISEIQNKKAEDYTLFRYKIKQGIIKHYENLINEIDQKNCKIKKELVSVQMQSKKAREDEECNETMKKIPSQMGFRRAQKEMKTVESIQNQGNPNDETGKNAKIRKTEGTVISIKQSERVEGKKKNITTQKRHEVEAMKNQLELLQREQQLRHEMIENKLNILQLQKQKQKELCSKLIEIDKSYMQSVQTNTLRENLCHENEENVTLIDKLIALSKQNTSPFHLNVKVKSHATAAYGTEFT